MILSGLARLSEKVLCLFIQYLLATSSLAKLLHGLKLTHRFTRLGILHITCTLKLMRLTWGKSKGLLIGWPVLLVFISDAESVFIFLEKSVSSWLISIDTTWKINANHEVTQDSPKLMLKRVQTVKKKGKGRLCGYFLKKKTVQYILKIHRVCMVGTCGDIMPHIAQRGLVSKQASK